MHYYQFNVGDYTSATAHLEPLEDLAYRRLLDLYYSSELPISEDLNQVARVIRMRTYSEPIAVVLNEFFKLESDGWHCERADIEIFKYKEKSHKASKSAKVRWQKAKEKQIECERIANAEGMESKGNAKQEPVTGKQEPVNKNQEKEKRKILLEGLKEGVVKTWQYLQEFPEPELKQDAIEVINHLRVTKNPDSTLPPDKNEIETIIKYWLLSDDLPKETLIKLINGAGSKEFEKDLLQVSYILKPEHRAKLLQLEESLSSLKNPNRIPAEDENKIRYPKTHGRIPI